MNDDVEIGPCSPFFIVSDVGRSVDFYVGRLGFDCRYLAPEDDPIFAIVGRGSAQIMLKSVGDAVPPLPNPVRHHEARWDTFIYTSKPDAAAAAFAKRDVPFCEPLGDGEDGLRGFALADPDGYVCFFGCPVQKNERRSK